MYYKKYIKYKTKYLKLKGGNKKTEFNKEFMVNRKNAILNLELLHDIGKDRLKSKNYIDMINLEEVPLTENIINDPEKYIKEHIINIDAKKSNVLDKFMTINNENNTINNLDLSTYIAVYDNGTGGEITSKTLMNIFGITQTEELFIKECEKRILHKSKISNSEFVENGKLKEKYLEEAIKIGFDPIEMDSLINFKIFKDLELTAFDKKIDINYVNRNRKEYENIYKILSNIELIIRNCKQYFTNHDLIKKIKNYDNISSLFSITNTLKNILEDNETDDNIASTKITFTHITKLIFSMKEARDSYYFKEIKDLKNDKIIFITGDELSAYRAILEGISVINYNMGIISFIAIIKDNNINIIGNPFRMFSTNEHIENKYKNNNIKELLKKIINNPIIKLKFKNNNKLEGGSKINIDIENDCSILNDKLYTKEKIIRYYDYFINKNDKYYEEVKYMFDIFKNVSNYINTKEDYYEIINLLNLHLKHNIVEDNDINYIKNNNISIELIRFIFILTPVCFINLYYFKCITLESFINFYIKTYQKSKLTDEINDFMIYVNLCEKYDITDDGENKLYDKYKIITYFVKMDEDYNNN